MHKVLRARGRLEQPFSGVSPRALGGDPERPSRETEQKGRIRRRTPKRVRERERETKTGEGCV